VVFTSKFVGAGPSSYKKRIYWAAVSQRLRNTALYFSKQGCENVTEMSTRNISSGVNAAGA